MALIINTNFGSINGQRNLSGTTLALSSAMTRLSSGVRVNSAKDDAAGLAIADRMMSQVRGMNVAVRNANDGISLTQTAEGALGSLTGTLQRMRDLAVQSSSNASVSASDRAKMDTEFKALNDELLRVVQNSEFNGKKILNGDLSSGLSIQVGANSDTNSRINIAVSNMGALLAPVTKTTLNPANQTIDAVLASSVALSVNEAGSNADLKAAVNAAKLANAAIVAAKKAAESPTDLALAKAASRANTAAASAVALSSAATLVMTAANKSKFHVSEAFSDSVVVSDAVNQSTNASVIATDALIANKSVTDSAQAASLQITATQLADAAKVNIDASNQNIYADMINKLTGDSIYISASSENADGTLSIVSPLNDAVNRAYRTGNTFGADREAQKALASYAIAKALASSSFVDDPLKTLASNETDKLAMAATNSLVVEASTKADAVAADYALSAINHIDTAIAAIDTERSNLGSTQNRFTTTIANLQNGVENQSAAKSRIMDADFAMETANFARAQILQQAGAAMLAQANQTGQTVMTLLR